MIDWKILNSTLVITDWKTGRDDDDYEMELQIGGICALGNGVLQDEC
jgi:hypothetical protein